MRSSSSTRTAESSESPEAVVDTVVLRYFLLACLAIAVTRGLVLATDDADALRALKRRAPGHPYERIRRLLVRAGNGGLCAPERANEIHQEMRRLGFWDRDEPFPVGS